MQKIGEIRPCPHCNGTSVCERGPDGNSCMTCVFKGGAGGFDGDDKVTCATCQDKGAVWIGPKYVRVKDTDSPQED